MTDISINARKTINKGWTVTFAGMGINLALGILYTWSVFSKSIPASWNWNESLKSLPYMIMCLVFALVMVPAGRMQDKISPRIVAAIGGILVGIGFIVAGLTKSLWVILISLGLGAGAGIGFGYASCTPPAVKWFPAAKTGLISGLVVSGFGLASVYAAPVTRYLINTFDLQTAFIIWGIAFLVIVVGLSMLIKAPPADYVPAVDREAEEKKTKAVGKENFKPTEMLKTAQFYLIWFMYFCGAGAGLMFIGKLSTIAALQARIDLGFLLVALLAIGNGAGRIIAGIVSDKIGRKFTMLIFLLFQALLIFTLSLVKEGSFLATPVMMAVISAFIGFNYGTNLSLFPAITKDFYGLKNFGVNYGLVFTAWGFAGFLLSLLLSAIYDSLQSFTIAYYIMAALLIIAALSALLVKKPQKKA